MIFNQQEVTFILLASVSLSKLGLNRKQSENL